MTEPANGFEFLEELRQRNGKQTQTYRSMSRYLDIKAREKGVPICGQFELTPLCNFSCKMCYVHLNADQLAGQHIMTVVEWKDMMHQAWEEGMVHVTLTGGECLAYPGFDDLFLYLHDLGCDVSVLTNGYLLDDKRIEFFLQHKPAMIQVTLYGWNDDVYERVTGRRAFTTVEENARKAVSAGLPVSISITPNQFLGEDVMETVRTGTSITKAFTVNSSVFTPRAETGRSNQQVDSDIDQYIRIYKLLNEINGRETKEIAPEKLPPVGGPSHECDGCGLRCGGGRSGFVVNWKGELTPCNRLDLIRAYPLKDGFKKAWAKLNKEANNWPRVPECEGCVYRWVCNTCAANMLKYAEPGKQPTKLCERTKYFVQNGVSHIPECDE